MKIKSSELIEDLRDRTKNAIESAEIFKSLSDEQLNQRNSPESWSILECIEHINLYGEFYLNEFENRILKSSFPNSEFHKTGIIGNYSANSMLPKDGKTSMKMKTFEHMNPINSELSSTILDKFIKQQRHFLQLLDQAEKVNLTITKCSLTIKGLKFRLGDALRFYAFHNERHIIQAQKILPKT